MVVPKINSAHGSETRNIINAAIDSINVQGKSIQDLVAEGQLTPEQYSKLIESVNGMISKGDVSIYDIDKNKGKIDLTFLSDEVIRAISGDAPVNPILSRSSITLDKTAFVKSGKNKFDKSDVQKGYSLSTTDGAMISNSAYSVSHKILVYSVDRISLTNVFLLVYYDSNDTFISAHAAPLSSSVPSNASHIKVAVKNEDLDTAQVEFGGERTEYEPFTLTIQNKYVENPTLTENDIPTLGLEKMKFASEGKNKFDKNNAEKGKELRNDGTTFPNSKFFISHKITAKPQTDYAMQEVYRMGFYDSSGKIVGEVKTVSSAPTVMKSPTNTSYIIISSTISRLDVAQIEENDTVTPYESFRYLIDEKYLSVKSGSTSHSTNINAEKIIAEDNAYENVPNVDYGLDIPSYEGSGKVTHPSVLYFKDGWNGFKFWMAMTPYPNSDNQYENPSIVASNDNVDWVEPAQNPIAPLPPGRAFQSDPCIFMKGNTMELWYREHISVSGGYTTELWRKTTTDGVSWTNKEKLFDNISFEVVRSPAVRYIDGKYCMWYHTGETNSTYHIKYAESDDGKNWTNVKALNISFPSNHVPWHLDAIVENGKTEIIISSKTTDGSKWSLFYTSSENNDNFHDAIEIIRPDKRVGKWDSTNLYRSAFVMVDGKYYVYYATPSKIGLTVGNEIITLNTKKDGIVKSEIFMSESNAFKNSDKLNVFPMGKIVYTKVFDGTYGADHGFPTSSGTVVTNRVIGDVGYDFQLYFPQSENDIYRRRSTSSGWTTWTKFVG